MQKLRCVLITNGNLSSLLALAGWIANGSCDLKKIYITYKLPSAKSNLSGIINLLKKSGFSYTYMKIWVNKVAPLMLRYKRLPATLADYVKHLGLSIPIEEVESANCNKVIKEIESLDTDLLISFSATHRFDAPLINAPKIGAINIHYGQLPKYAGLSPYFWHLHNCESSYGVTLHRIEKKLDSGGIIDQVIFPIGSIKSCLGLLLEMADQVSPMLNKFFDRPLDIANTRSQDLTKRTYYGHPTRHQVAIFHTNGYRMMDEQSIHCIFQRAKELTS